MSVPDAQAIETFSDTDRWTGSVQMTYSMRPNFTHKATMGLDAVNDQKTRNLPFGRYYTYTTTSAAQRFYPQFDPADYRFRVRARVGGTWGTWSANSPF